MQKFDSLSRKTILNYACGWNFILSFYKYPIIIYISLHNINNFNLHLIKNYMSNINGSAQVLNTNQLAYLFNNNIKFKFMLTGNMVALTFAKWQDVWDFIIYQKKLQLIVNTISIEGVFLNLCQDVDPLEFLQTISKQNKNLMIETTFKLNSSNNNIYNCLTMPSVVAVNNILLVLHQLAYAIENLSTNNIMFKTN